MATRAIWNWVARSSRARPFSTRVERMRANPWVRQGALFSYYLFVMASCIPAVVFVNENLFQITRIRGPSMYPFFNPDRDRSLAEDIVLLWKLNAQDKLQRGMIVNFWNPTTPEETAVKRVIGLEGDLVATRPPYPVSHVRVPPGHIWVEGDGEQTLDSNYYGPISRGLVIGRPTHIVWPPHRIGRVRWEEHAARIRGRP